MADPARPPISRRSAADYRQLLAEHATSGLTLKAFAESKGIKPQTLYAWHRRLRVKKGPGEARATLLPVHVVEEAEVSRAEAIPSVSTGFDVTLPGERVVSVPRGFDPGELRRLLEVLDPRC